MPFKSEKIKIAGTKFDRRIKLNKEQQEEIRNLYKTSIPSQRKLAIMYHVSKSLIALILDPSKKTKYKKANRVNASTISKEKRSATIREYRRYKQNLYQNGDISDTYGTN